MTIFTAFGVGITGLQAQSNKIGVISDNISNQSTVGYKSTSADFQTLVSYFGNVTNYSPGGVLGAARANVHLGGTIQGTSSTTDVAIAGDGFFPVTASTDGTSSLVYTRAGSFVAGSQSTLDPTTGLALTSGYLKNSAGFYLNGWALDSKGVLATDLSTDSVAASTAEAALVPVRVAQTVGTSKPTDQITIKATLKSTETPIANSSVLIKSNLSAAQVAVPSAFVDVNANLQSTESVYTSGTTAVTTTPTTEYDPANPALNMASGAITPQFSRSVSVIDKQGNPQSLIMGYLKTGANTWSVEVYARPSTEITNADTTPSADGQLTSGTVTFNADGTLATASSTLTAPVTAYWNNAGGSSPLTFNVGTVGKLDGLTQLNQNYDSSNTASPNYDASVATKNMTSGTITPDFTSTISLLDRAGGTRTLTTSYLKTDANTWAVEVYASPASSVTTATGAVAGQVASGTLTFNPTTGKLATVSSSLSSPVAIQWADQTEPTSTSLNWGTLGSDDGLKQTIPSAAYSTVATTPTAGYDPTSATKSMASGGTPPTFNHDIDVVDQAGNKHTITVGFIKTATNTWAVEIYAKPASDVTTANGLIASGTAAFNGDGSLASISPALTTITATWAVGDPSTIDVGFGTPGAEYGAAGNTPTTVIGGTDGLSQTDGDYKLDTASQNGILAGKLSSISIDKDGYVFASYDNNSTQRLYKVPLAIFENPDALDYVSGNVFQDSAEAGTAIYAQAGKSGSGSIDTSSLESSNVDLSLQLTDMVIAQRAYQSNTKTITTTDEMLQTLTQMLGQ